MSNKVVGKLEFAGFLYYLQIDNKDGFIKIGKTYEYDNKKIINRYKKNIPYPIKQIHKIKIYVENCIDISDNLYYQKKLVHHIEHVLLSKFKKYNLLSTGKIKDKPTEWFENHKDILDFFEKGKKCDGICFLLSEKVYRTWFKKAKIFFINNGTRLTQIENKI